ncbi:translocation/assembly module TamB domain-containing protein [Fulvivirgaceae bacterium BMA10]|uniref:Translocation/assembly module TamB domain-containing protein n=1 Tax=Splendidivirga corallicola TaxID=3051826 RepID=A0ABT8KKZ4_9BACT|nr:translocation/assembly module TamB domain-containing protein [Fulvivirgaceae bacterium BMA10]
MNKKINIPQVIKKRVLKTTLWIGLSLLSALLLLTIAIQIPAIQTSIVHKLTKSISEKTGFKSKIDYVNIRWFDTVVLEGVDIKDTEDNTMIGVKEILVDFDLMALLFGETSNIDAVKLTEADVKLIRNTPDQDLNINLFIRNFQNPNSGGSGGGKAKAFTIDDIQLESSKFRLLEPQRDSIKNAFDYNHFDLVDINANISHFKVVADTVEIEVDNLTTREPVNDFKISELKTFFRLSSKAMEFQGLKLHAGKSVVQDSIVFNYNKIKNLNHFNDSVNITANLRNSVIHAQDLALFAPSMQQFDEVYEFSGAFRGQISRFRINNFKLAFGGSSNIDGNIEMEGLPNFQESFIMMNLNDSKLNAEDLAPYVRGNALQGILRIGTVEFSGNFTGVPNDFVAYGTFNSSYGKFDSDINLKIDAENRIPNYSGNLTTYNFDLGGLLGKPDLVQNIDLNGRIDGSGFSLDNADFELNASIKKLGFKNYIYQNIETDARLTKDLFNGKLKIDDPNLQFEADASVDFREDKDIINVQAQLDTLFLKPLNLTEKEAFISSNLQMDLDGIQIDDIVGEAKFKNTYLFYDGKDLDIDTLYAYSYIDSTGREFNIESERVIIKTKGNYVFTRLFKDLERLYKEYKLYLTEDGKHIEKYYKEKSNKKPERYEITYDITLKDINPYFRFLESGGFLAENTKIEGKFISGYTSILSLYSNLEKFQYGDNYFYNTTLDFSTSKIADSTNVLAMAFLSSERQIFNESLHTSDLVFEGIWDGSHIDFSGNILQPEKDNYAEIYGEVDFLKDRTNIRVKPSKIKLLDRLWEINKGNQITITNDEIEFDSLKAFSKNQFLLLTGTVSDSTQKKLRLYINDFQADNINSLIPHELKGSVNGFVDIQNLASNPSINSNLQIDELKLNNFLVGNITGIAKWDNNDNKAWLGFDVDRLGKRIVDIKGYYDPKCETDQLDLSAKFDQANLDVIEPFLDEYVSQINGVGSGEFHVGGTLEYPILRGNGYLDDGSIRINYLNTLYSFEGDIRFDDNEIGVRNLKLRDDNNNESLFEGGLFHDGFTNFVMSFNGQLQNFKVLNTNAKQNNLYYGTAFVTGDIEIFGSFKNLNIAANAITNKGTKFFMPLNGSGEIQQADFIHFVERKDSIAEVVLDDIKKVDLQRLNFELDLEVTPDAYSEIIFDIKSGDIIRGRGRGKLKLQIDPKGDFNMFGNLEIEKGAYNFTLKNLINKEFVVEPNSRLSWYGDPYAAELDITAVYQQTASLLPLVDTTSLNNNIADLKRRYPAKVLLDLQGNLARPEIDFDIDFRHFPFSLDTEVSYAKSKLRDDEQELNRQVFSLIMLRKFSPQGTFDIGGGGSIGNSVSELLSNQLSYWITQVDENLEIDVDLGNLDEDAFNTFQLRLSYTFLEGRLRVTREGGFTDGYNNASGNSIVGDWTVEYLLTPDGKLRAKMYNKNNYYASGTGQENINTTGFSILYTENFDSLRDLWKKSKKQQEEPKPDDAVEENVTTQQRKRPYPETTQKAANKKSSN